MDRPDYQMVDGTRYRVGPECSEARARAIIARARRTGGSGTYQGGRVLVRAPRSLHSTRAAAWYDQLAEHVPGGAL